MCSSCFCLAKITESREIQAPPLCGVGGGAGTAAGGRGEGVRVPGTAAWPHGRWWGGDGAGQDGASGDPRAAAARLCASNASLILAQFRETAAISALGLCWQPPFLLNFVLNVLPVGKNQRWRSRAKPSPGFSQEKKIKWEACGAG